MGRPRRIVGAEGGSARVSAIVDVLAARGVPLAGVWLQDWSGLVNYTESQRVLWNWELDEAWYPGWAALTAKWRTAYGARVLAYANPYFANGTRYFEEGAARGYFVERSGGGPYVVHSGEIAFGMVDFTNPRAAKWMERILAKNLIGAAGASGWMHDFGEYLPLDAVLHDGSDPVEYHNRYALDWAACGRRAAGDAVGDLLWFDRSSTADSPGVARLFWMGDQMHTLDGFDGAESALSALLQGGLSGSALGHSDVGGYTTVDVPLAKYPRTAEVLMRWTEMSAFSDAVLRTHPGSKPSDNAQVWTNASLTAHFAKFAKIFACLAPYRRTLMRAAATRGLPLARPLLMHYPDSAAARNVSDAFLLGDELFVAPVFCARDPWTRRRDCAASSRDVPLVAGSGKWKHIFTGAVVDCASEAPCALEAAAAPIGSPLVFARVGGSHAGLFAECAAGGS